MGFSYCFRDRDTNEIVSLDKVDREIAAKTNAKVKDDAYCFAYDIITLIGCVNVQKFSDSIEYTEEVHKKVLADPKHIEDDPFDDLVHEMLIEKYRFEAW